MKLIDRRGFFGLALGALVAASPPAHAAKARHTEASPELRHRQNTKRGPVYVYRPAGVRPTLTVVYVHGFYDNADTAWKDHALAAKFARSRIPATFVVPEAPTAPQEAVVWPDLNELLQTVRAAKPKALPRGGPILLVGHSAAYRTIVSWLSHPRVSELLMVDALYGFEDDFARWLQASNDHRMVVVVRTTEQWAGPFAKRFRFGAKLNEIPNTPPGRLRHTRLVTINSQYDHMALVQQPDPLSMIMRFSRFSPVPKKGPAAAGK